MTHDGRDEIRARMASLDDHALLRLVALEHADYRPEAVDLAREELRRRGLRPLTPDQLWDAFPDERMGASGFCVGCERQTIDRPSFLLRVAEFFSAHTFGREDPCPVCGSFVRSRWFSLLFLPLFPMGRYRFRPLEPGVFANARYAVRRLRRPPR